MDDDSDVSHFPTGTVSFVHGATQIATCTLMGVGYGVALCFDPAVTAPVPAGPVTVDAVYPGDATYAASTGQWPPQPPQDFNILCAPYVNFGTASATSAKRLWRREVLLGSCC